LNNFFGLFSWFDCFFVSHKQTIKFAKQNGLKSNVFLVLIMFGILHCLRLKDKRFEWKVGGEGENFICIKNYYVNLLLIRKLFLACHFKLILLLFFWENKKCLILKVKVRLLCKKNSRTNMSLTEWHSNDFYMIHEFSFKDRWLFTMIHVRGLSKAIRVKRWSPEGPYGCD